MAVKQVLTLEQVSQDIVENKSRVRILWTSTQTGGSINKYDPQTKYWVVINGVEPEAPVEGTHDLNQQTTDKILDIEIDVPHDEQGNATVTVRTWMDTRISAGVVELTETLVLTQIPRAASISATNAYIEDKSTVVVGVRHSSHTYSIAVRFGGQTGYLDADGNLSQTEKRMAAPVINFLIPESFYDQIREAPSGICELVCSTYTGDKLLGQTTGNFTVTADPERCRPILTASAEDCNEETVALTGNNAVLIRGKSTARCSATAVPQKGASIRELRICGNALQAAQGTVELPEIGNGVFEYSATDSRGYTATCRVELETIPYTEPVCHLSAGRDDNTGETGWVTIEGVFFAGTIGGTENELSITCYLNGRHLTNYHPTAVGSRYANSFKLSGLTYTKTHTVEVTVEDLLSSVTKSIRIQPGVPVFDWSGEDFRFNVPVSMPQLTMQNSTVGDWIVEQGITEEGWRYRKWFSGLAECWRSCSEQVSEITQPWGAMYRSDLSVGREAYPIRFEERPVEVVGVKCAGCDAMPAASEHENTRTKSGSYFAVAAEQINEATTITADFYVAGMWKQEEYA